jgi:hypothetical protein
MVEAEAWFERLGYAETGALFDRHSDLNDRPYAAEIGDLLSVRHGIGATHVYCADDVPVVCFFSAESAASHSSNWIDDVRRRIWNQGLATVVIVLEPDLLHAYSVLDRREQVEHARLEHASVIGPWSACEFKTGLIQQRLPAWFDPEKRVDTRLLKNLIATIDLLERDGLGRHAAEALLAQVIFIQCLEQRGIIAEQYRQKHGLKSMRELVIAREGASIDKLVAKLGETFNGDFLNSHAEGPPLWSLLPNEAFGHVNAFLSGQEVSENNQLSFWGYDFGIMPAELISGIYESFLQDRQRKQGAYYTPRHLATLAVEQAFEQIARPHTKTVFDGACGSGILLTTAFQKMLAAAEAEASRQLTFAERVALMQAHIFGSDIDPTACWITAFSLYLCLIERLSQADKDRLQQDSDAKFPPLIAEPGQEERNLRAGKYDGNFFRPENSLAERGSWDIILSNPPWREGSDAEREKGAGKPKRSSRDQADFEDWVSKHLPEAFVPDRQLAAAFAYRAALCAETGGRITLILPLNLLIGVESLRFRQSLLALLRIDRIINFGDLRHVLFPNAKNACALLVGRPRERRDGTLFDPDEMIEYWTPKTDLSLALGRLAVSKSDRSLVSPHTLYQRPSVLIHRYWGSDRDIALLEKLQKFGTLRSAMKRPAPLPDWRCHKGFHATDRNHGAHNLSEPGWQWLRDSRFLATNRIPKAYPIIGSDTPLPTVGEAHSEAATPGGGDGALYNGNRVIWRNGVGRDLVIRAAFSDRPFAFQHTACAIGGVPNDKNLLCFVAAYLRSQLATYFILMNSYSVIADRQAVSQDEILSLPFISPDEHPRFARSQEIISDIATRFQGLAAISELVRVHAYEDQRDEIEDLIVEYFGLTPSEKALVSDTARYVVPSVQPTSYGQINTPLSQHPTLAEGRRYAAHLNSAMVGWRRARKGDGAFCTEAILGSSRSALGAVRLQVRPAAAKDDVHARQSDTALRELLVALEEDLADQSKFNSLVLLPDLFVAAGPNLYIVKPMQRRFWLARSALADAERIVTAVDELSFQKAI